MRGGSAPKLLNLADHPVSVIMLTYHVHNRVANWPKLVKLVEMDGINNSSIFTFWSLF